MLSKSKARQGFALLVRGFTDRRALPVTALISLQTAYYAFYSLAPGVYQRKLNKLFTYSQNNRLGIAGSLVGHKDIQSYLFSMFVFATVGYRHALVLGPVSFAKFVAGGTVCGAGASELAYWTRGRSEGWMMASSGLAGATALLLYHSVIPPYTFAKYGPLLGLAVLAYGGYYGDVNVAGGAAGAVAGAALLSI